MAEAAREWCIEQAVHGPNQEHEHMHQHPGRKDGTGQGIEELSSHEPYAQPHHAAAEMHPLCVYAGGLGAPAALHPSRLPT